MDPNNGEIFAWRRRRLSIRISFRSDHHKAGRAEYQKLLTDPDKPLIDRAIQASILQVNLEAFDATAGCNRRDFD